MFLTLARVQDGSKLFSGGADNLVRIFDTSTGTGSLVGQHDAPVKCVRSVDTPGGTILATGSWDKTLKVRTVVPWSVALLSQQQHSRP